MATPGEDGYKKYIQNQSYAISKLQYQSMLNKFSKEVGEKVTSLDNYKWKKAQQSWIQADKNKKAQQSSIQADKNKKDKATNAATSAEGMKAFYEKTLRNIERAEQNAEVEAFLAEPTSSTAHEQYLKNIQRALNNGAVAAAATRKNTGLAALQERMKKTEAKLAPQLGMKTGLPQSKYMNGIANTLGMERGLPSRNYLQALRNKYGVPAGKTLRTMTGQTRKAGGNRRNRNRNRNRNRQTRRRV